MKLSDYVIHWGKDRPDHAFLSLDGKTITYGEADAFTKGKGESLPQEVHGKVVALYLTDPASQVLWFLAVERAGAVPLLVHEYIKGERFEELFDARPIDFFLTDSETGGVSVSKREDGLFFGRIKDTGITRKEGVAVLTSGSSGLSKILFRRVESWADFFPVQNKAFGVDGDSILYTQGSMAFTGNLNMLFSFMAEGAVIAGTMKVLPRTWMKEIISLHATHIYMIPSKLYPLSRMNGSSDSVKYILTGSQLMTERILTGLKKRFPKSDTVMYYGASELNYVSCIRGSKILEMPDSVGKPFPGVNVTIKDGEIFVESPYRVEDIPLPFTCHDLGYFDKDGWLHFTGRREDVYNIKGNHVSRQRVISHILMTEGIDEAELLAVPSENGLRLIAFVAGDDVPDTRTMIRKLHEKLEIWEIPHRFIRVKSIPKRSTGKTDKDALLKILEESKE